MTDNVPLLFLLAALATARLTRLVAGDFILQPVRDRIERRLGADSKLVYLMTCDWCASFWIAWPVVAATILAGDRVIVQVGLLALAASQVSGMLAAKDMQ